MGVLFSTPFTEKKSCGNKKVVCFYEIFYFQSFKQCNKHGIHVSLPYIPGIYLDDLKQTYPREISFTKKLGKITTRRKHSKWAKRKL